MCGIISLVVVFESSYLNLGYSWAENGYKEKGGKGKTVKEKVKKFIYQTINIVNNIMKHNETFIGF